MRILAYRISGGIISSQVGERNIASTDILHWLIFSHSTTYSSCLKVVWSLSDFATTILSLLPESVSTGLSRPPHRVRFGNYKLFYITDKVFSVEKNGSQADFYDLSQYYPSESEPATLEELQNKANQLVEALIDLRVGSTTTLSSPVACFKGHKLLEGVKDTVPTIFDAQEGELDAYEIALQCTPREWISNFQIGNFLDLYGQDISSAYPYHASQLLDLRDCIFRKSTELDEAALYGFLVGDFTVYPNHPLAFCSPFLADRGDGVLVNFTGTVRNYSCLLDEVRALYHHKMGEFKLKYGWFVSLKSGVQPRYPFKELMETLYSLRGDDELKSYIVKRVMNGIIGKLLEVRKDNEGNITEYGELYNSVYHSIITARTRLQVFDFLVQNKIAKSELAHIGVDGVKATRYISLPKRAPMGGWRCSDSEPTIILSPGAVLTDNRNFKQTGYAGLVAECMAKSGASKFGVNRDIDLSKLWVNQNRVFPELPRTGRELLEEHFQSGPVGL